MAKKATTTKQNNNNEPGKFAMMKMFFTNERTRFITGLVIAIITIYIGLALISFFFTGGADQSKIENVPLADLLTNRGSVENWTGVRGAVLSLPGLRPLPHHLHEYPLLPILLFSPSSNGSSTIRKKGHFVETVSSACW